MKICGESGLFLKEDLFLVVFADKIYKKSTTG